MPITRKHRPMTSGRRCASIASGTQHNTAAAAASQSSKSPPPSAAGDAAEGGDEITSAVLTLKVSAAAGLKVRGAGGDELLFDADGPMAERARSRASRGWAINLHRKRHAAGRTFAGKGTAKKNAFVGRVEPIAAGAGDKPSKRRRVVAELGEELKQDVSTMRGVATDTGNRELWSDLWGLRGGRTDDGRVLTDEAIGTLIGEISGRIVRGQDQLAAQDLDVLAR